MTIPPDWRFSAGVPRPQPTRERGPAPALVPAPTAMVTAIWLMRAGSFAAFAYGVALGQSSNPGMKVSAANHSNFTEWIITLGIVEFTLWQWMARKNKQGRNWARVLSTVLFGMMCLYTLGGLRGQPVAPTILLIEWAIGLTALILVWRPESTRYYQAARLPPPVPGA